MHAYDEIMDFVTSGPSLQAIIDFSLSEETEDRVRHLHEASQNGTITADEREELREYEKAVAFMIRLKERAKRRVDDAGGQ